MKILAQLKQKLEGLRNEAIDLASNESASLEQVNAKKEEIKILKAKIESMEEIEAAEEEPENKLKPVTDPSNELVYKEVFMKAFKNQPLDAGEKALLETKGALSSSTGEDGGFLVPIDQQTKIKELKRSLPALENYVTVVPVTTLTGSRNIEKNALHTPFQEFTENNNVPDSDSPQFVNIAYSIKDRGGILKAPNNLFNDSDIAIENYLNNWLAKKSVATRNSLIISILNLAAKEVIVDYDDIKSILNIHLDPAITMSSKVFTNQSGYNFLDTLKDNDGKYLLKSNPLDAKQMMLDGKYEVVVLSDKILPNRNDLTNYQAPIIIGDLEEAIALFDREQMSLLATTVGGEAFTKNRTDIRAITREDVKSFDSEAFVFGEVAVGTVA